MEMLSVSRGVLRTIKKREAIRNTENERNGPAETQIDLNTKRRVYRRGLLYRSLCCRDCGGVGPS